MEFPQWELDAPPRKVYAADRKIRVNQEELETLFECPVCRGRFEQAGHGRCTHRFCRRCLTQSISSGHRKCPSCRSEITSHRQIIDDPKFDELIKAIFESSSVTTVNNPFLEAEMRMFEAAAREESSLRKQDAAPSNDVVCVLEPFPVDLEVLPPGVTADSGLHALERERINMDFSRKVADVIAVVERELVLAKNTVALYLQSAPLGNSVPTDCTLEKLYKANRSDHHTKGKTPALFFFYCKRA